MHLEDNQAGLDWVLMTPPLIERVEPNSFGVVGDRLLVHLSSSKNHRMSCKHLDTATKF